VREPSINSALRFERLYRDYGPDVLAYCRRRAAPEVADDVTAETFLVAWRRLPEVPRAPRGWLLGIARLTLANEHRSARRRKALSERLHSQPQAVAHSSDPSPVLNALRCLSDLDQEALLLSAWDGVTSREAAQVLGCTSVAFRLRLHRARRRLASTLAAELTADRPLRLAKEEFT
jgi:RNA polymerase sigma-70 factor (ECF subfamily)